MYKRQLLNQPSSGIIIYISPLKALINDQFGRLERLCEDLDIPVWHWHSDVSATMKEKFIARPSDVLLITSESHVSMLCNRESQVAEIFDQAVFLILV